LERGKATFIPWEREKESNMDRSKFERLVREFPFLAQIFAEMNLSADYVSNIEVKRGDRNLLEVKPSAWSHDAGGNGEHCGHRLFWCIASGETIKLESAWSRVIPYHRNDQQDAAPIGAQLLSLNRDAQFVVEVHEEHWDWEELMSAVVIYKMNGFDWRQFCRLIQTAQNQVAH
jgi:hypothetical protein